MAFYLGSNQIDNANISYSINSNFYNEENLLLQRQITQFSSNIDLIGNDAFRYCSSLISVNLPQANTIGGYAFAYCTSLTSISLPKVSTIGDNAFAYCSSLTSIDLPQTTTIGSSAFRYCSSLSSIDLPQAISIGGNAFYRCYGLVFVQCSALTIISGSYSFSVMGNQAITNIYGRFAHCSGLQTVSFPKVQTIHSTAFYYCSYLTSFIGPSVLTVGGGYKTSSSTYNGQTYRYSIYAGAFAYCYRLSLVSLPVVSKISTCAFAFCYNLLSLYLMGSSIPSLVTTAFYSTPISTYTTSTGGVHGSIYVPASLYSNYITATGWSLYSERIVSVQGD